MEDAESTTCYGPGSIAGAVIGTFLTTCLILALAALTYRQWRRNKGKHLVLVTDPEIVEEAYAFDNPCFKDTTIERPTSINVSTPHSGKDASTATTTRWSTAWSNLRHDKRRTLDDSVVTPKATRVSVVGLRSRDFTGLGFNVCGNMREGIYVKDLLHRGPASESGRINPGDRILSVKISFRTMVFEDALTILSYASPYEVELEVESGGSVTSKPTTLMKKSVGPSPLCMYHPLFRSQSIPQLFPQQQQQQQQQQHFSSKKRLFVADPLNDSVYSNVSSLTRPSSNKSTPDEGKHHSLNHSHPKFGIKVLPALDSTVHRVQNDNEHNTNLERRHSKKLEEKRHSTGNGSHQVNVNVAYENEGKANISAVATESIQRKSAVVVPSAGKRVIHVTDGIDVPDRAAELVQNNDEDTASMGIPSDVPAEVHNAGMAARGKRKSSSIELLNDPAKVQQLQQQHQESQQQQEALEALNETKSPQKSKRKAPAPPSRSASLEVAPDIKMTEMKTATADDLANEDVNDYAKNEQMVGMSKEKPTTNEESDNQTDEKSKPQDRTEVKRMTNNSNSSRRVSESDTDSEIQNSFTTIELNSSDITVHHTPVPEAAANDDEEDDDDVYRKAASLGDLSKYEARSNSAALLERAQSLDMTEAAGGKKRKAPLPPPEDIHESTEDLTKLDQIIIDPAFERSRKLKKSNEWGTLQDAIWSGSEKESLDDKIVSRSRKKSNASNGGGTLERSKSNVEIKTAKDEDADEGVPERLNVSDGAVETSLELYNLPLSKKLTQEFIKAERLFNPEEDNALARIINDGIVVKSPTPEQVEFEFRKAHPLPDDNDNLDLVEKAVKVEEDFVQSVKSLDTRANKTSPTTPQDPFKMAINDFDASISSSPLANDTKVTLAEAPEVLYKDKKEVVEEPMTKVTLNMGCPGCDHRFGKHSEHCTKRKEGDNSPTYHHNTIKVENSKVSDSGAQFETHFAKPIINVPEEVTSSTGEEYENEATYNFGSSVTVNSKSASPDTKQQQQHNVSNVSVSSGEKSNDDTGLVNIGSSPSVPQKTYVVEIKVSPSSREEANDTIDDSALSDNEEIVSIMESSSKKSPEVAAATSSSSSSSTSSASSSAVPANVTSNGKLPPGKKPPVPPRRSDATKLVREVSMPDKQVVYVSEYKSPPRQQAEEKVKDKENKLENSWVIVKDVAGKEKQQEVNPWGNGSGPAQPVTNIVLSSSGDEKIVRK